jgi:iron complex transport system substrate-binding protein
MVREKKDIYIIDDQALKEADPDIIIAQGLCKVCSPYFNEVDRALQLLNNKPDIVMLDPHNLDDILASIMQVAKAIDKEENGKEVIKRLKARIDYIKQDFIKPRVLAIEWLDPLYTAGHWVPDMINLLAINLISKSSEPSRRMSWEEVLKADPDIIILMACGFDVNRIIEELHIIERNPAWYELRAVRNKQVYAVNASAYFNRPGPRVITGIEILAKIIHPTIFKHINVPNNSFKKVY